MNTPEVFQTQTTITTSIRDYSFNEAPHLTSTVPTIFNYSPDTISKTVSYNMFTVNVGVEYKFYQNGVLLHSTTSKTGTFELLDYDIPVTFTMQGTTSVNGTISASTAKLSRTATTIYFP